MAVGFLVIAAYAPSVLGTFVSLFGSGRSRFFVHLDAKADLASYQAESTALTDSIFIPERYPVFWGGFNMVLATFALMRAALADPAIDILVLLSDDCFPLLGPAELTAALVDQPTRYSAEPVSKGHGFWPRYERMFALDSAFSSARPVRTEERALDRATVAYLGTALRVMANGKPARDVVYVGRQCWSLDRRAAEAVLSDDGADPIRRVAFQFSAHPDEMYIQTLMRERYGPPPMHTPVFSDYDRQPKPFVYSTREEIARLDCSSDFLFLRKLDPACPAVAEAIADLLWPRHASLDGHTPPC